MFVQIKKYITISILVLALITISTEIKAQSDTLVKLCTQFLESPYISDGQQYKSLLNGDEMAEFKATFYGGSTYRIVGATGVQLGNLEFSVYDTERNLLFSNKKHQNIPYWDFKFTSTIECIIEATLDEKSVNSGFALMLIGFKQ